VAFVPFIRRYIEAVEKGCHFFGPPCIVCM